MALHEQAAELKFRDPAKARALSAKLTQLCEEIGRDPISVMHVCGSHEQAIAKYGLRSVMPRPLDLIMGPGGALPPTGRRRDESRHPERCPAPDR